MSADKKQKFCQWEIPQESCVITKCRVDETVFHNLKDRSMGGPGARSDITELGLKSASIFCLDSRMRILRLASLYLTVCWASCIVSVPTSKTQPCYNKLLRMVVSL